MKKVPKSPPCLQVRITVKDVVPEIWRRVVVPESMTLAGLHAVLQVLMGWEDRHLYAFVANGRRYSPPSGLGEAPSRGDSVQARLSSLVRKAPWVFTYEYDFGDSWQLILTTEIPEPGFTQVQKIQCLAGSRHGPVEDSGGTRGYMEKAKIHENPRHKLYAQVQELFGASFDPEAFDLAALNAKLRALG